MTGVVATTIESCQLCELVILPGDEMYVDKGLVSCIQHGSGKDLNQEHVPGAGSGWHLDLSFHRGYIEL